MNEHLPCWAPRNIYSLHHLLILVLLKREVWLRLKLGQGRKFWVLKAQSWRRFERVTHQLNSRLWLYHLHLQGIPLLDKLPILWKRR